MHGPAERRSGPASPPGRADRLSDRSLLPARVSRRGPRRAGRTVRRSASGHDRMGDRAGHGVDPGRSAGSAAAAPATPWTASVERVRQGRVRERVGRRERHRAGHVADGVVQDAVRARRRDRRAWSRGSSRRSRPGRPRRRRSPRPASSCATIVLGHDDRRAPAGHEHRADHEVGVGDARARPCRGCSPSVTMRPWWIWSTKRRRSRFLSSRMHLGLHALRDPRRVPADVAGAEHDDARRAHAGHAAEQHAAPAVLALEEVRADLRAPCGPATSLIGASSGSAPVGRAAPSRRRCR